jgi:hypothetical protein
MYVCIYICMYVYVLRLERLCDYKADEIKYRWLSAPIHVNIITIINIIIHRCVHKESGRKEGPSEKGRLLPYLQ